MSKGQRQRRSGKMRRGRGKDGTQGQWQQESPFSEILEHARRNEDIGAAPKMVREKLFRMKG